MLELYERLDAADPLAGFRDEFVIEDPDLIYLDGNSLGRLPVRSAARIREVVGEEWGAGLIRSWNRGWYEAPTRAGDAIAPLIGAAPGQVIVGDSTSVNLYKLVMAALRQQPDRPVLVSDDLNFPTDLYIAQGAIDTLGGGRRLALLRSSDGMTIPTARVLEAIDERVALVMLSHVAFKSGYMYDAAAISARAREVGALVLWDLSHSVGAVPVRLDEWGADLAVGCTYKYLNAGPGAPAFLYVREALQSILDSPIWGWFGEADPFAFDLDYRPAPGVRRFLVGTPPMLSLSAIEPAVEIVRRAGIERIREKSIAMTGYLIERVDARLAPLGFTLGTPREPERRGSHVSIRHPEGYRINRALIEEMALLPDFRAPDNIRLGIAPLYNRFAELHEGVERIARVVQEARFTHFGDERDVVT